MTQMQTQFLSLMDFISQNAAWYPQKPAIIFEDRELTWGAFDKRIHRVANYLIQEGLAKGDRVAVLAQNCLEYPEILFGSLKAGAIIVPISTMLKRDTVLLELKDSRPKAIFAGRAFLDFAERYESVHCRVALGGGGNGWIPYDDIHLKESEGETEIVIGPDDFYNIVYSSGTTGAPKGIVHSHQARVRFAMTCGLEFRVHHDAVSLVSTPIYSNGTQLIFLPTILTGGTVVLMSSFDPLKFLQLVQLKRCTHAFLVPTQFVRIMAHSQFESHDTSSVEILLSAAAPLRQDTKREILAKFPKSNLLELYGLTEGISTVLRPNEQIHKLGSVGKPRMGGDIKILDKAGRELPRGETGEIAGYNFSMMTGYFQNPEKTSEVLWMDDRERSYIRTGDIGKLDSEGYLYIIDRLKDMIISGGMNIFPSDLERVLFQHPEVAEAAVVGIPDREWGERPIAVIVKKEPGSPLSEDELKTWANSRLAGYQKLLFVEFRSFLPKNDLGKILKNELRASYID
jgi:acyl-CoA synthetase (AMP-forming)/AMP-acid ligase II